MKRYWDKVAQAGDCWEWQSTIKCGDGYGLFWLNGKNVVAHRLSYEWMVGEIPEGLVLDHLCRNRKCVNPYHLDPVTIGVNVQRGEPGSWQKAKTHCKNDHEFTEENTYWASGKWRQCRACHKERTRARRTKHST